MYKWIMFVLFVGAGVLGVGTMLSQVSTHHKELAAEEASTGGNNLKIVASNYKFDQPQYTVKAGSTMKVALSLKEGIHEVHIAGSGVDVKLTKAAPSQEIKFDKPGEYIVQCVLPCGPGHPDMKSKLIVQ
jgi:cytochrome c oxidase subunit 2